MRKVSKHDWGGDRATLKLMYTSLIRSKLDYASFLFSNAADCHLKKLDQIQYKAIRIITGNYQCTMLDNLEAEINLLPLALRRRQLTLNFLAKPTGCLCTLSKMNLTNLTEVNLNII